MADGHYRQRPERPIARGVKPAQPIGDAPVCLEHLGALVTGPDGWLYGRGCGCVFEARADGVRVVVSGRGE